MRHGRGREQSRLLTRQSDNAILIWGAVDGISMSPRPEWQPRGKFRDMAQHPLYVSTGKRMLVR